MSEHLATDEERLRGFANAILDGWPDVPQWDACDLQDIAEKFGLLEPVEVTEPCGEGCNCAEWDDFPMNCYRKTKTLLGKDRE